MTLCAWSVSRERTLRRKIRNSLRAWANFVLAQQGYGPAEHHLLMIAALEALDNGPNKRLMVLMPPGSAKSTYASLLFPVWWMARNPSGSVIAACHTANLAEHFGRGVRNLIAEHGERMDLEVCRDARAVSRLITKSGGTYFATGVQGAVTGRRADLAVIDDPIRSFPDAESASARNALWNWYCSELATRLKPRGKTVLVMTRWHPDDLAGRLLRQGGWTTLRLPALAEEIDPLGREPGAALWPDWENRELLLEKQTAMGERSFSALFQQAPRLREGGLFQIAKIRFVDVAPSGTPVRAWDLAGTADTTGDPDWTAGVKLVRDENGCFTVSDIKRVRVPSGDVATLICSVAQQDGESVLVGLPKDPGQSGIYQISILTRLLAGYNVVSSSEIGSKIFRAEAVAAQVAAENFSLVRASWNDAFLDELCAFPAGSKDDQVDALSRAFRMLAGGDVKAHYRSLPIFAR